MASPPGVAPQTTVIVCGLRPAEGRGAAHELVGVVAAQERIDEHRLEPGVPGAAGFGGAGVDAGGGEGDLAAEAQHRLAQLVLFAFGGELGDLLFDDVDDDLDEGDGVLEAEGAGEFDRGGFEHHVGGAEVVAGVAQPFEELPHSGLGHQGDHRALLGGQVAEPGEAFVHPGERLGRQRRRGAFDVLNGRGQVHAL